MGYHSNTEKYPEQDTPTGVMYGGNDEPWLEHSARKKAGRVVPLSERAKLKEVIGTSIL